MGNSLGLTRLRRRVRCWHRGNCCRAIWRFKRAGRSGCRWGISAVLGLLMGGTQGLLMGLLGGLVVFGLGSGVVLMVMRMFKKGE